MPPIEPEPPGPTVTVAAHRVADGIAEDIADVLAVETAVAIEFNGRSHAVMLATPADLEDFALGFALTEGIIRRADELQMQQQEWTPQGVVLHLRIPELRFALLETRERNLTGRTGCGLCGTSTLETAIRPVRRLAPGGMRANAAELRAGMEKLATLQPFNAASGAVHAAGLMTTDGGFTVREDVGRHNAVDKAVGAVARAGATPHSLLVTSRASYEIVHKAAEAGCSLVAAISAPTALAVQLAVEAGIALVGWVRPTRFTVYSGELT